MKGTRAFVDVMEQLIRDWPNQVRKAVVHGSDVLYVGCIHYNKRTNFILNMLSPSGLLGCNSPSAEPSYLTLEEANEGHKVHAQVAGQPHEHYTIIDVIRREVVNVVDRNGSCILMQTELEQIDAVGAGFREAARVLEWYRGAFSVRPFTDSLAGRLSDPRNAFYIFEFVFAPDLDSANAAAKRVQEQTGGSAAIERVTQDLIDKFYLAHVTSSIR